MNRKLLLQVEAKDDKSTEYHFSLEFYVFQEKGAYVAYCPALDLSTCDETYNGAISSFYEMFQLHIECCVESGTLQEDLLEHRKACPDNGRIKNLLPYSLSVDYLSLTLQ